MSSETPQEVLPTQTETEASTSSPAAQESTADAQEPVDPAEAARLKREARKARILGKGSDRLARITNTGRGDGASAYLDATTPLGGARPTSSSSTKNDPPARSNDDDPLEVDISALPTISSDQFRQQQFGASTAQQQAPPPNPMEALMQMMQGGGPGGMGDMGGPPGEGDDMGLPPQLAAMMQSFGGGGMGGGAQPGPATAVKTKGASERAFDFLQATLVLGLAVWAAKSSLFNTDHSSSSVPQAFADAMVDATFSHVDPLSTLQRWARLAYERPSPAEWSLASSTSLPSSLSLSSIFTLPPFWIFISLEILLQAMRIVLFSNKTPAPQSMLGLIASQLPIPNLELGIRLISKYLALVNALVNDLAIVVFVIGMTILWAGWQLGGAGALQAGGVLRDEL